MELLEIIALSVHYTPFIWPSAQGLKFVLRCHSANISYFNEHLQSSKLYLPDALCGTLKYEKTSIFFRALYNVASSSNFTNSLFANLNLKYVSIVLYCLSLNVMSLCVPNM